MMTAIRELRILEQSGECRWCHCTETRPCEAGCSWANRAATLCSECVPLDTMIRSTAGRRELAVLAADARRERERLAAADKAARALVRARVAKSRARRRVRFTRADARKLRKALDSGKRSITFADQTVTFASSAKLRRLVELLEARS